MKIPNGFLLLMLILGSINTYLVMAYDSGHIAGETELYNPDNRFMSTLSNRINMIVPSLMVIVCLIAVMLDFGVVGITFGAMIALVLLNIIGIVAMDWTSVAAYCVLGIILIIKMKQ